MLVDVVHSLNQMPCVDLDLPLTEVRSSFCIRLEAFVSLVKVHDLASRSILKHEVELIIIRIIYDLVELDDIRMRELLENIDLSHRIQERWRSLCL